MSKHADCDIEDSLQCSTSPKVHRRQGIYHLSAKKVVIQVDGMKLACKEDYTIGYATGAHIARKFVGLPSVLPP